jgi:hypothetical protein
MDLREIDVKFEVTLVARSLALCRLPSNQVYKLGVQFDLFPCQTGLMLRLLRLLVVLFARCFRSRCDLVLENLALRQQLGVLKQKHPQPRLAASDRLFWVVPRQNTDLQSNQTHKPDALSGLFRM